MHIWCRFIFLQKASTYLALSRETWQKGNESVRQFTEQVNGCSMVKESLFAGTCPFKENLFLRLFFPLGKSLTDLL